MFSRIGLYCMLSVVVNRASQVTTLWRYTTAFIIIIIIFYTPGSKDPQVKN